MTKTNLELYSKLVFDLEILIIISNYRWLVVSLNKFSIKTTFGIELALYISVR